MVFFHSSPADSNAQPTMKNRALGSLLPACGPWTGKVSVTGELAGRMISGPPLGVLNHQDYPNQNLQVNQVLISSTCTLLWEASGGMPSGGTLIMADDFKPRCPQL